jgi:trk system potassium uptake protein TrkH
MSPEPLVYAVRPRVVAKYVGELCLPLALATLVPLGAALVSGSWPAAAALAGSALVAGGAGWWSLRIPEATDIQTNEAMAVVSLAFLVAAAVMTPPFMAWGLAPEDAFFEAVSGVTTTGLSVLPDPGGAPWDLLLTRSWLQWVGGLGFVTLSVLLVSRSGPVARQLDVESGAADDLAANTRTHGRRSLVVYGALTAAGVAALLLAGVSPLDAFVHAFSSVSTGGFSTGEASLGGLGAWPRATATLLFVLGALPLVLVHRAARGRWRPARRDPQLLGFLAFGVVATGLLVLFPVADASWGRRIGDAMVMAFSAQSTTGFSTLDTGSLDAAAKLVLMGAMFVGGCAGSTAGGIKVWRALVAVRLTRHTALATALPRHAVRVPTFAGEELPAEERSGILILVLLFLGVIGLSWLAFLTYGHPPLDALFDVVSATGTVGLSTGVVGPELATGLKWVVCADMLMGRLEILAVLVLLAPGTWFRRSRSTP